jgi:hypothetical protein
MKKTIAQTKIDEMTAQGFELVGRTHGTFTFRAGSNLARQLQELGLSESQVVVKAGARAGKNMTERSLK